MRVNEQIALKLDLERRFLPTVKALFNAMKTDYRISIATGKRTRAEAYMAQWQAHLAVHYKRVQKAFRGAITGPQKQTGEDEDLNDEILAALLLWAEQRAPEQARYITLTNQKALDESLAQARQAFADEGRTDYTNRELATVAAAILGRRLLGRTGAITTLETQAPAEATKLVEMFAAAGLPPEAAVTGARVLQTGKFKQWQTMRDERVRAGHKEAEGQLRPIERPFIVAGERLMYPGDTSLGASISNVINCRCVSVYKA